MKPQLDDFIKFSYKGQPCIGWIQGICKGFLFVRGVTDLKGHPVTGTGCCSSVSLADVIGLPITL